MKKIAVIRPPPLLLDGNATLVRAVESVAEAARAGAPFATLACHAYRQQSLHP